MEINTQNNEGERAAKEYVDTTLRTSHYQTCESINRVQKICASKLNIIMILLTIIFATYSVTALLGKTTGLPIAYSGDSIDGLRDKEKQKEELLHLYKGIILNDPDYLNEAKMVVRYRPDGTKRGADFYKDLTKREKEQMISKAFEMEHVKVLNWIKEQPFWDKGLSKDFQNLVKSGPERYGRYTALEWREKYYDMKKHHASMEHTEDTELLDEAENKIEELEEQHGIDQSKLNAALAFIHDDVYYWQKVNVNHLNENWEIEYAKRMDDAPKMKKHLGLDKKNLLQNALLKK